MGSTTRGRSEFIILNKSASVSRVLASLWGGFGEGSGYRIAFFVRKMRVEDLANVDV